MNLKPSNSPHEKLHLRKALLWILLSVFFITGSSAAALVYFQYVREKQKLDPANNIVAIVQTSSDVEGLRTVYLAELLNLSVDRPTNLYSFNSKEARQKLLSSPLIKDANVRKIRPGTCHVDYTLRKPIAFIGDYTNTAIDANGVVFPFKPFFTPKILPSLYLGEDEEADEESEEIGHSLYGARLCKANA